MGLKPIEAPHSNKVIVVWTHDMREIRNCGETNNPKLIHTKNHIQKKIFFLLNKVSFIFTRNKTQMNKNCYQ